MPAPQTQGEKRPLDRSGMLEEIFRLCDKDGDGILNEEEMECLWSHLYPLRETVWRYRADSRKPIDIRFKTEIDGPRTTHVMQHGTTFRVSQTFLADDGITFLKLADGRGWLFDRKLDGRRMCECQEDEPQPWKAAYEELCRKTGPESARGRGVSFLNYLTNGTWDKRYHMTDEKLTEILQALGSATQVAGSAGKQLSLGGPLTQQIPESGLTCQGSHRKPSELEARCRKRGTGSSCLELAPAKMHWPCPRHRKNAFGHANSSFATQPGRSQQSCSDILLSGGAARAVVGAILPAASTEETPLSHAGSSLPTNSENGNRTYIARLRDCSTLRDTSTDSSSESGPDQIVSSRRYSNWASGSRVTQSTTGLEFSAVIPGVSPIALQQQLQDLARSRDRSLGVGRCMRSIGMAPAATRSRSLDSALFRGSGRFSSSSDGTLPSPSAPADPRDASLPRRHSVVRRRPGPPDDVLQSRCWRQRGAAPQFHHPDTGEGERGCSATRHRSSSSGSRVRDGSARRHMSHSMDVGQPRAAVNSHCRSSPLPISFAPSAASNKAPHRHALERSVKGILLEASLDYTKEAKGAELLTQLVSTWANSPDNLAVIADCILECAMSDPYHSEVYARVTQKLCLDSMIGKAHCPVHFSNVFSARFWQIFYKFFSTQCTGEAEAAAIERRSLARFIGHCYIHGIIPDSFLQGCIQHLSSPPATSAHGSQWPPSAWLVCTCEVLQTVHKSVANKKHPATTTLKSAAERLYTWKESWLGQTVYPMEVRSKIQDLFESLGSGRGSARTGRGRASRRPAQSHSPGPRRRASSESALRRDCRA